MNELVPSIRRWLRGYSIPNKVIPMAVVLVVLLVVTCGSTF